MAAIAYVSDEKMLEYHRFNGSHTIVFWRLSTKKFTDFKPGDLLFFLARDENNRRKEKGLTGYGCFVSESSLSIDTIWKNYGRQTGYNTRRELYDAIRKSCKTEEIPKKIGCLLLDRVVFFQSPVYLSSLGYQLSNKLESFTYLDRDEGEQTLKILNAVREIGLDSWSAMENETMNDELFQQQLVRHQISTILQSSEPEREISSAKAEHIYSVFAEKDPMWINRKHNSFLIRDRINRLYFLYDSTAKTEKENYYKLLGEMIFLRETFRQTFDEEIQIIVLTFTDLSERQIKCLNDNQVECQRVY
ncbi:MAG: hypothetical protein IKX74_05420 [Erysipelotrichaceae bacterium]|nr:hypothetical protein [Erysipelotrichaceae bacterium]MBR5049058.1 hypothetical protein [Erysipelotrichaceae bacterium]